MTAHPQMNNGNEVPINRAIQTVFFKDQKL